jgi:uncharacterized membrane protein
MEWLLHYTYSILGEIKFVLVYILHVYLKLYKMP